uniref:Death domain-containing protein n=1 Tax=Amphimedon queenslandica TaxID=400682 RepID=A0A1X7T828_AMPQE
MARRRRIGALSLEKERLAEIHEELLITGFTEGKWFEFGLKLGLSLQTLKTIEADYGRAGASRCLMECLEKWLSRADNVTGPLSWITLANGLRRIGEVSSAERISKLSDPASELFQRYSVRLSLVSISEESVDLLCTERLISNETRTRVESVGGFLLGDTLREIRTSITEDHNKLRALRDILLKSDEAKTIGQDILKECDTFLSDTVTDPSETDLSIAPISSVEEVFVSEVYNCRFDEVRVKFGDLRHEIIQLVVENVSSADDIKQYLSRCFPEVKKELSSVSSVEEVMNIVETRSALLLEAQDNLTVLMKEFSLIRLTIGHYTVYDKRIRYKVMNNECLAEEIKLADGEEQELRTLLDYKEGSIFEQDKQLNIIKKRKEYIERTLQIPESKLKVKLLTRENLMNRIFKSKKSETQYFQTSLLMKAGREEALVEYMKEIELLQENISLTSEQLLMSQKGNIEKKDQCTQSLDAPTAESIYTACIGYHGIRRSDISFSEGEQLEIYNKYDRFKWYGRSLVSGDSGDILSSCVYSMLESLQLLEFILSVEEVSLPILQKIRNDSSSNDEKASLFLETIKDDPVTISALRQDKEQHDKGVTGRVYWYSNRVILTSPSPVECNEMIGNINNNHKEILLHSSSTNSTVSLLSSTKLHTLNLRRLEIYHSPLTNDCIQYLCILLTNNKTIQELVIRDHSISDRGVTSICQALEHNSTLTSLDLKNNPLITSTSGQVLSHLLLNNSSLVELNLRNNSLYTESILLILQSLMDNNGIRAFGLDKRHEWTCINTYPNYHLIQDRVYWD